MKPKISYVPNLTCEALLQASVSTYQEHPLTSDNRSFRIHGSFSSLRAGFVKAACVIEPGFLTMLNANENSLIYSQCLMDLFWQRKWQLCDSQAPPTLFYFNSYSIMHSILKFFLSSRGFFSALCCRKGCIIHDHIFIVISYTTSDLHSTPSSYLLITADTL